MATSERTPKAEAAKQPIVIDCDVQGDRVLARVDRGDIALVVEAPAGVSESELDAALEDIPECIERTTERFYTENSE